MISSTKLWPRDVPRSRPRALPPQFWPATTGRHRLTYEKLASCFPSSPTKAGGQQYKSRPTLARSDSMSLRTISSNSWGNPTVGFHPSTSRARPASPTR